MRAFSPAAPEEGQSPQTIPISDESKEKGKLAEECINRGLSGFTPDVLYAQLVNNYATVQQLYGETLLKLLTGYSPANLERNLRFPEFQRELKEKLKQIHEQLQEEQILDEDNMISEKGIELASLVVYGEELDRLAEIAGRGESRQKTWSVYGDKGQSRTYKRGDRYKDIDLRGSIRTALRRKRNSITQHDLKTAERNSPSGATIIYGMDASASMRGDKLRMGKRAGVALAFQALQNRDSVGLISFGTKVKTVVEPTKDLPRLLRTITGVRASTQTDFTSVMEKATELLAAQNGTKHVLLLTDALPTVGEKPSQETLNAVSTARAHSITISIAGIQLDNNGTQLAKQIASIGDGRFYLVKQLEDLDMIVLDDYYATIK